MTFHRFVPGARIPQRADRSAIGTMPTRAFRYCEPIVTASAFGYYIFPPISFSLMWDGTDVIWTWEGAGELVSAARRRSSRISARCSTEAAPEEITGILAAVPRRPAGARHRADLDRPRRPHRARLEPAGPAARQPAAQPTTSSSRASSRPTAGSDRCSPILRLTKTNVPIEFRADYPLFQVQPIPRHVYDDQAQNNYELVPDLRSSAAGGLGRLLRHGGAAERAGGPAARPIRHRRPQAAQGRAGLRRADRSFRLRNAPPRRAASRSAGRARRAPARRSADGAARRRPRPERLARSLVATAPGSNRLTRSRLVFDLVAPRSGPDAPMPALVAP